MIMYYFDELLTEGFTSNFCDNFFQNVDQRNALKSKIFESQTYVLYCYDFYYIDMSVLPKNRQLVFSIRNYIRYTSVIRCAHL